MSVFKTVETHWDCSCIEMYIHDKRNATYCEDCDCHERDYPDSRETEVQEGSQIRHALSY